MNAIELVNISKRYGNLDVVRNLNISVGKGEILALLGPSGCGKTTTLRIIAGFVMPDEGHVHVGAKDMVGLRPYERNVGLLFQDYALFPHMTVEDNIAFGLKHRQYDRSRIPARIGEMLDLVQLGGYGKRRPHELSGGQQQRVALARALATHPEVVLLDEPLSALDAKLRFELRTDLRRILSSVGASAIVVTHDQEEAMSLGDSIAVMNKGSILQTGTATEIYSTPASIFVAEFIGRSNWFRGRLEAPAASPELAVLKTEETELLVKPYGAAPGSQAQAFIRPEAIRIRGEAPTDREKLNIIPGKVDEVVHLGAEVRTEVSTACGALQVIEHYRGTLPCAPGDEVQLSFRPEDCIAFPAQ